MKSIVVLMSTYNGEKFLKEQIESLLVQKLPEDIELKILVRDDGSSDSTTSILDEYKSRSALNWYTGENLKPAKSFWNLVQNAPKADYYAFCDQDDVWFNDKLFRAIDRLNETENRNQPLLYCSNVLVSDAECNPIRIMNNGEYYTDFAHSLIYSLAPGCTMVFNDRARDEFVKYDMNTEFITIHDWLAHKIVAMTGEVVYDPEPSMYYRQHGNNVIGAQTANGLIGFFKKVKRILGSNANSRSSGAQSLMNVYADQLSAENLHTLDMVANYRFNKVLKKEFLRSDKFRNNRTSYLKWTIRLNKV